MWVLLYLAVLMLLDQLLIRGAEGRARGIPDDHVVGRVPHDGAAAVEEGSLAGILSLASGNSADRARGSWTAKAQDFGYEERVSPAAVIGLR